MILFSVQTTRIRRKSGDDLLDAREKKKEASPGFLDIRPRSKSDASKGKKPTLMTTVKNAVQVTTNYLF